MEIFFLLTLALPAIGPVVFAAPGTTARAPRAYRTAARMPDRAETVPPGRVHLDGYLGTRVANNEKNRLLTVEEEPLLAGFRKRPGSHPWIGEHVGKWLHAATLAWAYTGDERLRAKLDRVAAELIKTQEPDGYLGTYAPDKRFGLYKGADWDVWSHKYNLIGLLTYYRYTGSKPALEASRKIGDLLLATFGPGKKSILSAGTHAGMAATSVLEPVVLLYRATGDTRYLDFARYLVSAWDEPNGPRVLTTLLTQKSVARTANGKAYEMLSNLVGLCELARATGGRECLQAAINAWEDITAHQLYITGSASHGEHFHADYDLPNQPDAHVGETCVTVTWIQLNSQLLRLTGDARYGDELERSFYNHLAAAQRPDGAQWCYYTALEGTKPYGPGISCCVSSGPRGMAMVPELAYLKVRTGDGDTLAVNLFEPSRATLTLGGQQVTVEQRTDFPRAGNATLTFHLREPATFGLQVRSPEWAQPLSLQPGAGRLGAGRPGAARQGGWTLLPRRAYQDGDRVTIAFSVRSRLVRGDHGNTGRAALAWGPFVLAYDEGRNPDLPPASALALCGSRDAAPAALTPASDVPLAFTARVRAGRDTEPKPGVFVPFAEAGSAGSRYRIWLRAPGTGPAN